jgi:hypothetical protein
MNLEPAIVQRWQAVNDRYGNPRRVFVVWSADGKLLDAVDEGYSGRPEWMRELVDLGDVYVSPSDYKDILKQGKRCQEWAAMAAGKMPC